MNRRTFIKILACVPGLGAAVKVFAGKREPSMWANGGPSLHPSQEVNIDYSEAAMCPWCDHPTGKIQGLEGEWCSHCQNLWRDGKYTTPEEFDRMMQGETANGKYRKPEVYKWGDTKKLIVVV